MADPVTAVTVFWDLKASDVLKFASEFISAVAWPLAIAFIVRLFKHEIVERIPLLSELTLPGGISAKFNETLSRVEADVASTDAAAAQVNDGEVGEERQTPEPGVRFSVAPDRVEIESDKAVLRANPTGAVMESWKSLEQLLRHAAVQLISLPAGSRGPKNLIKSLSNASVIDTEETQAILELFELRNLVAHSPNRAISENEAKRFVNLAQQLQGKLLARILRHTLRNKKPPDATTEDA